MTDEEKQELETLRLEKLQRTQRERAQAKLEAAGVPASFAGLLAGRMTWIRISGRSSSVPPIRHRWQRTSVSDCPSSRRL